MKLILLTFHLKILETIELETIIVLQRDIYIDFNTAVSDTSNLFFLLFTHTKH